jgi:pimeloyl-ACP methyl ester carboxylesterase
VSARTDVVEFDGGRLEFDVAGEGPDVVLLHPGLWDRRTWDDQFGVFARSYRVVRYDARGYGRSSRLEPGVVHSAVRDLAAVMDAAGMERAALVGCSRGGRIALDFAISFPGRVTALVLVAPGVGGFEGTPEEEAWWEAREDEIVSAYRAGDVERVTDLELAIWAPLGTTDGAGARIREIALDNVEGAHAEDVEDESLDPPAIERLESVAAPTLVLPADRDPGVMDRACRLLAERIPNARLVRIPDVDHVVNMRKPAELNDAVLAFLGEVL